MKSASAATSKNMMRGAFVACALLLGVSSASTAHASTNDAHVAVSVSVVSTCKIATSALEAGTALQNALDVDCGAHHAEAQISAGATRTFQSASYSGDLMLATINF